MSSVQKNTVRLFCVCFVMLLSVQFLCGAEMKENLPSYWPQGYSVERDEAAGKLTLSTRYYTVEHNLKKGGVISRINYTYGKADNLVLRPIETSVRLADGTNLVLSDVRNSAAKVGVAKSGENDVVTVECNLVANDGKDLGIMVKTRYEYRWGYIKVHKEVHFPDMPISINNMTVVGTVFDKSLTKYGYRGGIVDQEGGAHYNFGTWQLGQIRAGTHFDQPLYSRYVPLHLLIANQGVEGVEWFSGSNLSQWDFQMTGKTGCALFNLDTSINPRGISVSICPVDLQRGAMQAKGTYIFDYYIGMSILEGHAVEATSHKMFGREKGKWTSEEEIKQWAGRGVKIGTFQDACHYYGDGMFWRDGMYPPYPPKEMAGLDKVLETCRRYGIKVAPYFSTKQLHTSTDEFKKYGQQWGLKPNDHGKVIDDLYEDNTFGVRMCLKSVWLKFLKSSIDKVLKNQDFQGVYYDWCVGLFCNNALHMGEESNGLDADKGVGSLAISPTGHWDIDGLIELIEWTRGRVGKDGVLIIHDTKTPMLAIENFANHILAFEWGYGRALDSFPKLDEMPLEWNLVGARSRGVIPPGLLDDKASSRVHRLMALSALMSSVVTIEDWADLECEREEGEFLKILEPLGDIKQYRFEGWKNKAAVLDADDCMSAVYSREGQAYVLLANFSDEVKKTTVVIEPQELPYPLSSINSAMILVGKERIKLDAKKLVGGGEVIPIGADSVLLVHVL